MSGERSARGRIVLVSLLASMVVGVAACGGGASTRSVPLVTTIQGKITGEQVSAKLAGTERLIGVANARLTRNGQTTTTALDDSYFLIAQPATHYQCFVDASSTHQSATVTLPGGAGQRITLNFDTTKFGGCAGVAPVNGALECGGLVLQPGTLTSTVIYPSGKIVSGAGVQCSNPHDHSVPQLIGATDIQGHYTFTGVPVGTYWCIATLSNGAAQGRAVAVSPAATATLKLQVCESACPRVSYHGGAVIHHLHAYLIFWQPTGHRFDPARGDSAYEGLIARFINDLGGTAFYGLLGQYFDGAGPVGNDVTLGGTYVDTAVDTAPYQHRASLVATCTSAAASVSDPLYDQDIQAEVSHAIAAKHWTEDDDAEFFVFAAAGAQVCIDTGSDSGCTFPKHNQGVCGWHSAFYGGGASTDATVYAFLPDQLTSPNLCMYGSAAVGQRTSATPNGDLAADALISSLSHELFESVSDPLNTGSTSWYQDAKAPDGGEIGDICEGIYGPLQGDGANVVLRNGGRFIVQTEWSNAMGGCALR